MQRRLLAFFQTVRNRNARIEWTFALRTVDNVHWPEAELIHHGLPPSRILFIEASASFPFATPSCNGCFSAQRVLRPRKAAFNPVHESEALVTDVLSEFAQRTPGLQ